MTRGIREALGRLALIVLGIGLGVVALEVVLQLGAGLVRLTGRSLPSTWLTMHRRVLCLGDSNTFGVTVPVGDAYPPQLAQVWNGREGVRPIEVLNLGYPGNNSSRIRRDLPHLLDALHPDVITIMVGANDWWSAAVPPEHAQWGIGSLIERLMRASRVVRLLYMVRRATESPDVSVTWGPPGGGQVQGTARVGNREFEIGWQLGVEAHDWVQDLRDDLAAIAHEVRAMEGIPVFLTYPSDAATYGSASVVIRDAAPRLGVRLVDLNATFRQHCPGHACRNLLLADGHPDSAGHLLAAQILADELRDVLAP